MRDCVGQFAVLQTDAGNNLLRRVNLTSGLVTTLAGSNIQTNGYTNGAGASASFYAPSGIAVDGAGTFAIVVRSR